MAGKKGVSGGARVGAGRRAGIPNKATLEREALALRIQAELAGRKQTDPGRKLAREVLDDLMHLALGLTAYYQPQPKNVPAPPDREPNEDKFLIYANMAKDCAKELANYQSPKFKAVAISIESKPGASQAPAEPGQARVMSAQDAYRALRDGDMIELTANKAIAPTAAKRKAG